MDLMTIGILVLFVIAIVVAYIAGRKIGEIRKDRYWEGQVPDIRSNAIERSRTVLGGQFSEQLAPFLPDFKYLPTECRFMGKPIDFIVFKGMDSKDIEEVVFLEIKSGDAKLNDCQKKLKAAIQNGKVRFEEYRIPRELTDRKE